MNKSREESPMRELRALVASYIERNVTEPSLETVEKDLSTQSRPADHVVCLINAVRALGQFVIAESPDIDKNWLRSLPPAEIQKRIEVLGRFLGSSDSEPPNDVADYVISDLTQNHLMAYLLKEINWIVISILSASYTSALILTRSCFELLVGIATRTTGSMRVRLDGIPYLKRGEKQKLLKRWYSLCGWVHPHGRWVKEVCPIYATLRPMFHPKLCTTCHEELRTVVDFFMVIILHTFGIPPQVLENAMRKSDVSVKEFQFLSSRVGS